MTEPLDTAISRLTAWVRDYGHEKQQPFIDDVRAVLEAATELAALRSQVVAWRDGGARGGELPSELTHGMPILAWAKLDAHPVAVSFLIDEFGKWFAPLPGTHCDIEWEDISKWCPLSEIPTPRD